MITKEVAFLKLKKIWNVDSLHFFAKYTKIDKNDGVPPHGYFHPYLEDSVQLRYPADNEYSYKRSVSLYVRHSDDLIDGEVYLIELALAEDKYRFKYKNPYLLKLVSYKVPVKEVGQSTFDTQIEVAIKEIYNEYLSFPSAYQVVNQANSVELLATDIYSENKRFIYELIQNADDAAVDSSTGVEIRIYENYVVLSHKGKPFSSRDIRGLCGVGFGSKVNDDTKTGYKGIGFKSVFGQPEGLVFVKSEDVLFKFDRHHINSVAWNSNWGSQLDWENENKIQFKAPWQLMPILCRDTGCSEVDTLLKNKDYAVRTIIKIGDPNKMREDLTKMLSDASVLLFLRKVRVIDFYFMDQPIVCLSKKIDNKVVELYVNGDLVNSYYLYKKVIEVDQETRLLLQNDTTSPDKIRNMKKSEFAIAVQINLAKDRIQLLDKYSSPIYSYLPTSDIDYEFPFLVNANFILDASRQKLSKDHLWNAWLFKIIGNQVVDLCSELAENKLYLDNYFELLSKGRYFQNSLLYLNYNRGIDIGLRKIPFVINQEDVDIPAKVRQSFRQSTPAKQLFLKFYVLH